MQIPLLVQPAKHQQLPTVIKRMLIGPLLGQLSAHLRPDPVEIRQPQREDVVQVVVGRVLPEAHYEQVCVEDVDGGVAGARAGR